MFCPTRGRSGGLCMSRYASRAGWEASRPIRRAVCRVVYARACAHRGTRTDAAASVGICSVSHAPTYRTCTEIGMILPDPARPTTRHTNRPILPDGIRPKGYLKETFGSYTRPDNPKRKPRRVVPVRGCSSIRCPRWDSNPHCADFEAASSTNWDTGASCSLPNATEPYTTACCGLVLILAVIAANTDTSPRVQHRDTVAPQGFMSSLASLQSARI